MKIAIQTLGCKVNQVETQALELLFTQRGHDLVPFEEAADAYIINSCTVTAVSDKKSRQAVRQAQRKNPRAVVALCGCYPQVSPEDGAKLGVHLLAGTGDRVGFVDNLEAVYAEKTTQTTLDKARERKIFEILPGGGIGQRTRAMLKVEDGCSNFCTYCIIPYARGPVRSLAISKAAEEAARLSVEGYREIVLTGIELSSWGRDFDGDDTLEDLVEAVCKAAPDCRIRLGSLEPRTVTEAFCRRMKILENLCPHFHLSLQSGCDETLRRMGRRYDTARYLESVKLLGEHFQSPGITTDLIVGFPGETEEEFTKTLTFLEACRFSAMHIFPYSKRKGTPAAAMENQVLRGEKARRAKAAEGIAREMAQAFLKAQVGQRKIVLLEEEQDGYFRGYTPEYAQVRVQGENLHNRLIPVKITEARGDHLLGDMREEVQL